MKLSSLTYSDLVLGITELPLACRAAEDSFGMGAGGRGLDGGKDALRGGRVGIGGNNAILLILLLFHFNSVL